jgi:hypothetical protein
MKRSSYTNIVLDPDEYLPVETLQWCQNQLAQLNLSLPPQARDFILVLDRFEVPNYYRSLIYTARSHSAVGAQPRLQVAANPRGGYGWEPQQEVMEGLAAGNEEI